MSSKNPWLAKNLKDFWFLNCPECDYKTKIQNKFEGHAVKNHPLSREIFVYDNEESDKKEDLCGSKFAQHRNLSRNFQSVHKKKTPFQCSICDKVFEAKQTLERHLVNVHKLDLDVSKKLSKPKSNQGKIFDTNKRPFCCSICDKAFATKQTLERHLVNFHNLSESKKLAFLRLLIMMQTNFVAQSVTKPMH